MCIAFVLTQLEAEFGLYFPSGGREGGILTSEHVYLLLYSGSYHILVLTGSSTSQPNLAPCLKLLLLT